MADERLKYHIEAIWTGKGATTQAKADIESVGKKAKESTPDIDSFSKSSLNMGKVFGTIAATGALTIVANQAFEFGKASVAAFSDAEEAYGKFDVVFGEFARQTESELDAIAEATGRSKYELIDYASTIQDTFVPLGFARDEAAKMSTSITQLAIDLASFNNLETADVIRDLQSALVGNTETLRKYGVVAQETQIKQEALALGLWDGKGAIDAQAKASAILSLAYKGTADAQGDAIRTADSYANKQRELEAATLDLKVALGEGLAPSITETTGELIQLTNYVTDGIQQARLLEEAYKLGAITDGEYLEATLKLGVGIKLSEEEISKMAKAVRENAQGMDDATATIVRYYRGMGALADAQGRATETNEAYGWSLQGVRKNYEGLYQSGFSAFADGLDEQEQALLDVSEAARAAAAGFDDAFTSALVESEAAYGRWVTTATVAGGKTEEQQANFDELTSAAERLHSNIRSLQGGTAGLGLTEDELNKKLAENYEELSRVEAALGPLASITTTYSDVQKKWVVDADAVNKELFGQITAMSDNAVTTASAAYALGLYDETQLETALNAAIINEKINKLAESFVNGEISAGQMRGQLEDIVNGSPYASEIDVLIEDAMGNIDKVQAKLDGIPRSIVSKISVIEEYYKPGGGAGSGGASGGNPGGTMPDPGAGGSSPAPLPPGKLPPAPPPGAAPAMASMTTINNYNNTREAAALAMAQAERIRRQRLDVQ